MGKLQDHPVSVALTFAGTIVSIVSGLAGFGRFGAGVGTLLCIWMLAAWLYSRRRAPLSALARVPATSRSSNLATDGLEYSFDPNISLPQPDFSQQFILEAFKELATGGFEQIVDGQARDWPLGLKIGNAVLN